MSLRKSENRLLFISLAHTIIVRLMTIIMVYQSLNRTSLSIHKAMKNIYKSSPLKITYFC